MCLPYYLEAYKYVFVILFQGFQGKTGPPGPGGVVGPQVRDMY